MSANAREDSVFPFPCLIRTTIPSLLFPPLTSDIRGENATTMLFAMCSCANGGGGVDEVCFQGVSLTFILKQRITSSKLGYVLN